jgi:hypothetical protein
MRSTWLHTAGHQHPIASMHSREQETIGDTRTYALPSQSTAIPLPRFSAAINRPVSPPKYVEYSSAFPAALSFDRFRRDTVWRDPDHAGQFHRFTKRVAGDSADFVCGARAMGLACSLPTGLADSVNTGGIGTGRESATSNYHDASGHTKTLQ